MRDILADRNAPIRQREQAMEVLLSGNDPEAAPILHQLLDEAELRGRAIRGLAGYDHPETPDALLAHYSSFDGSDREAAVSALSGRPGYARELLAAMAAGEVPRSDLSAYVVRQMLEFDDDTIEAQINELWGQVRGVDADKQELIDHYKELLDEDSLAEADLSRGRQLYTQSCAACHQLFGTGGTIGPDITGSNRGDLDYILRNMIDPNSTVGRDYQIATVHLSNGRIISGMIRGETDTAVTVQMLSNRDVVARDDIERIDYLEVSMMPEGLLLPLDDDEVRDLTAYLGSPRQVPLPGEGVTFDDDGAVIGAIEGDALAVRDVTRGDVQSQGMGSFGDRWSGDRQLWWTGGGPGDRLTLEVPVDQAGAYELQAVFTKAPDYAIVQLHLDGEPIGEPVDLYDESVVTTDLMILNNREMEAGTAELTIEIVGANPEAVDAYMFGLDFVRLSKIDSGILNAP